MPARLIAADRLVTGDAVHVPGWITIRDGRVLATGGGTPPGDPEGGRLAGTLLPGFVDMHAHGAGGLDLLDADTADVDAIAERHARSGTTSLVASLASAPLDELERAVRRLAPRVADGTLAGIHLEGPYLSPVRRGAHPAELLRPPDTAELDRILTAGGGAVRMVTVAPELPGGLAAVRWLVERGVVVALGHSDADAATSRAAIDAGATVVTHLFNGMRPLHHRDPGLVGVALTDDRVTVELIADGQHLAPEALEIARRCAGGRLALVSDAMAAMGCGDGSYRLVGRPVQVRDGVARVADGSSLAGAVAPVAAGLPPLMRAGLTWSETVWATDTVPRRTLGLPRGGLAPGSPADLVVLGPELAVQRVMRAGRWLDDHPTR